MYYIYILTNKSNNVMYIGITNDLMRRLYEHKEKLLEGFTKRYNVNKLVYFEEFKTPTDAIKREKQLKHWNRSKKNAIVETVNPEYKDLTEDLFPDIFKK